MGRREQKADVQGEDSNGRTGERKRTKGKDKRGRTTRERLHREDSREASQKIGELKKDTNG